MDDGFLSEPTVYQVTQTLGESARSLMVLEKIIQSEQLSVPYYRDDRNKKKVIYRPNFTIKF